MKRLLFYLWLEIKKGMKFIPFFLAGILFTAAAVILAAAAFSAAAASSAMAFDFNWFKANIMTTNTSWDDKELESRLLRQHIFVDYFDDIYVYGEKK